MTNVFQDPYHTVHYHLAQSLLPALVFGEDLSAVLGATVSGELPNLLANAWNHLAGVSDESTDRTTSAALVASGSDFGYCLARTENEESTYLVVIEMPPVRGPLESSHVVIVARLGDNPSVRYFTCEAPMMEGLPYVLGERNSNQAHLNLGAVSAPDVAGVLETVSDRLKLGRLVLLAASNSEDGSGESDGDAVESPNIGEVPVRCSWKSTPAEIAAELLLAINGVVATGGSALVFSAEKATGLRKKVSTYFQVMLMPTGEFQVEARADYSYWGVELPRPGIERLVLAGFTAADSSRPNHWMRLAADLPFEEQLQVVTAAVRAFVEILEPTGKIRAQGF